MGREDTRVWPTGWTWLRGLPPLLQVPIWLAFWPVAVALKVLHGRGIAPVRLVGGLALAVLGLPLWLATIAALGAPADELVAAGAATEGSADTEAEPDEDVQPEPEPDPEPEPEPEPGEDPDPPAEPATPDEDEVGDEPEADAPRLDGTLEVHFLDVGQADATLLLHDEVAVLVDTGDHRGSQVVGHLADLGVERLDLVIVTHPHADHIGQFDQVLDTIEVDEVWWSGSTHTTATFDRAVAALERSDAAYEEPRSGDTARLGPLELEVVNPPVGVELGDLHDAGLAVRFTYGEVRLLVTGDIEAPTEARMVGQGADTLRADLLQLGHHGSRTSTSPAFLAAVDPSVAVYSASPDNSYGHPHGEVVDRVLDAGVELYGTPVHGTVVVTTDGRTWTVRTERDGTPVAGGTTADTGSADDDGGTASGGTRGDAAGDEPDGERQAAAGSACAAGQVDVNTAGFDDLQRIHEIGPDRAQQILDLRPFGSVRELDRIAGIGPARLAQIIEQGVACVG